MSVIKNLDQFASGVNLTLLKDYQKELEGNKKNTIT